MALTLLTVILERVKVCNTDTKTGRDVSYKLNVVPEARSWG